MVGYIYKYTSPNGKSYIGQTRQGIKRRADWSGKGYRQSSYFFNAINKYGFKNFTLEILHTVKSNSLNILIEQLNELEVVEISLNNTTYPNGYNIQAGGNCGAVSEYTREKIRQKLLGKKHTPERRLNQSLARLGKEPWNKGKTNTKTPELLKAQGEIGKRSTHTRWHVNRGVTNLTCQYC
jgi:group I intron endonuclease